MLVGALVPFHDTGGDPDTVREYAQALEAAGYNFLAGPSVSTIAGLMGSPADHGELLSWLFYVGTGLGPFSGQAVHFQRAAPEKLPYAINRYRREAERHYTVLDKHLAGREFIVGKEYTIADISGWGWVDRASFVLPGNDAPLAAYPNVRRWFHAIDARPAVAKARAIGSSHSFKKEVDEETRRALFPSNYPPAAA